MRFDRPNLFHRQTSIDAAHAVRRAAKPCCTQRCIKVYTIPEIRSIRISYWKEDRDCKSKMLRTIIAQHSEDVAYLKTPYRVGGHSCCARALERLLGIGHVKFIYEVRYVRHGDTSAVVKKNAWTENRWRGTKMQRMITCIRGYTGLHCTTGDWMPHKRELHLAYNQLTQLYALFIFDVEQEGITEKDLGTYQHFTSIFRHHFPHVIVHKRKEFSQCSMCAILYESIQGLTDRVDLKVCRQELEDHLELVLAQKQVYWDHIKKSINKPTVYMSTILDGMDTMKSIVPHWIRMPHAFDGIYAMQLHIEGVLQHGHEPPSAAYVSPPGVRKGACLAIETLCRSLMLQKRRHGYIPPIWYIQADNASSEFKNSVCMLFCAMLIQVGLFRKVRYLLFRALFLFVF